MQSQYKMLDLVLFCELDQNLSVPNITIAGAQISNLFFIAAHSNSCLHSHRAEDAAEILPPSSEQAYF